MMKRKIKTKKEKINKLDLLNAVGMALKEGTKKEKKEILYWMNHAFENNDGH